MGKTKKNHGNRSNPVLPGGLLLNFDDDEELSGSRPDPIAAIEEQLGKFLKTNLVKSFVLYITFFISFCQQRRQDVRLTNVIDVVSGRT